MKHMIMAGLILTLITLSTTLAFAQTDGPAEIKYPSKMGTVTFDHTTHQTSVDCATCHHTGEYVSCKSCHGVDAKAPKAKMAFHKQCKSCHKEQKQGPTKCKECHVK